MTARFDIYGSVVGFDLPKPLVDDLVGRLAFAQPRPTNAEPTVLYRLGTRQDGKSCFLRDDLGRPPLGTRVGMRIERVFDDIHLSIALHATTGVFIHAGIVSWDGVGIVVPGRSSSGKSTLIEQLVRAGASYLSDEYTIIQPDGSALGYPRPIHLRTSRGRTFLDPRSIGAVTHTAVAPRLLVFTRFDVSAAMWHPESMAPATAALALFDTTVVAELQPQLALATAATVVQSAQAVHGIRPEASAIARQILDLAERVRGDRVAR